MVTSRAVAPLQDGVAVACRMRLLALGKTDPGQLASGQHLGQVVAVVQVGFRGVKTVLRQRGAQ
ncbi:hypothetical protein RSA46_11690 [Pseudomonas oryzihabitans]|nr:hypothetical protein BJP27_04080 [Pseudomonas psychrotolerans]KTS97873.1 hypothetical protein NS376_17280 [Pseudomonas psychrotolerans]KTT10386.1 hypothetical protein NS2R_18640 [Pseudomonas psychrotolerans]KTT27078.1 hypothetical protein SB14R_00060 [Pseudomonas psychrotolerans]KTT33267.1 hypothetical protein SB9_14165 [Pseudomonas psychrotolerans]